MKVFLHVLAFILFFIQNISAQNCITDSVVVHVYFENRDNNQGLLVQTIVDTSIFKCDSGTVRIFTQSAVMGGGFTPVSLVDTFWVHTDTIRNVSGTIAQIYSKIGSVTGWKNYRTENFIYNSADQILSKTILNWNGSAWDSVYNNTWIYNPQNKLLESSDYTFTSGVRIKLERCQFVYLGTGQPYSKTISIGNVSNQWEFKRRFIYTYTGNLRTAVEVGNFHTGTAMWLVHGIYNYTINFGEYSFIFPEFTPITLNGINTSDTLLTAYDTLEERTYSRSVHFTAIDTTDIYFGVEGLISYSIYNRYNNKVQITNLWSSSWATFDLTDSVWYSVDRPYRVGYSYDLYGRCDTIHTSGGCTNPCGGDEIFLYDSYGRLYYTSYNWETMVTNHFISNSYYFSDTASIQILIAASDTNYRGCPNGTFQPTISIIGGCRPYTVQWHPSAGLSSDTVLQPEILIDTTITYTITVTDNMGHIDSSSIRVGPAFTPLIIVDSIYCNGSAALRLPVVSGTFHWYLDSLIIPGASLYNYTAIFPGDYHVSGMINVGNIYTQIFSCPLLSDAITIHPTPQALISFSNDTIFTNLSGIEYDWFLDNVLIHTGTDSYLIIHAQGNYRVLVKLQSGCTYMSNVLYVLYDEVVEIENSFSIFPNPVHDRLLIDGAKEQEVIITDLVGKNIFNGLINPDNSVDVSFLKNGSYFLLIKTESKNVRFMFLKM